MGLHCAATETGSIWYNNLGLTTQDFGYDFSCSTNLSQTWYRCRGLTIHPEPTNTGNVTNWTSAFRQMDLVPSVPSTLDFMQVRVSIAADSSFSITDFPPNMFNTWLEL